LEHCLDQAIESAAVYILQSGGPGSVNASKPRG
jgi:hypothetical protein